MAIYHLSIKIGSRSTGKSAVVSAAYRAGEQLRDERTGETADYTHKSGVVYSDILLPEHAPVEYADRSTLWNAVEKSEKASNAQVFREFEIALPVELPREQQIALAREFGESLTAEGMCVDVCIHDKGDGNPHAHLMCTMRGISKDGSWMAKSKKVYDLDEDGERILQKVDKQNRKIWRSHKEDTVDWNQKEKAEEWRARWADTANKFLSPEHQIDHRSYERQGLDIQPTVHEGKNPRYPQDQKDEVREELLGLERVAGDMAEYHADIQQTKTAETCRKEEKKARDAVEQIDTIGLTRKSINILIRGKNRIGKIIDRALRDLQIAAAKLQDQIRKEEQDLEEIRRKREDIYARLERVRSARAAYADDRGHAGGESAAFLRQLRSEIGVAEAERQDREDEQQRHRDAERRSHEERSGGHADRGWSR